MPVPKQTIISVAAISLRFSSNIVGRLWLSNPTLFIASSGKTLETQIRALKFYSAADDIIQRCLIKEQIPLKFCSLKCKTIPLFFLTHTISLWIKTVYTYPGSSFSIQFVNNNASLTLAGLLVHVLGNDFIYINFNYERMISNWSMT